MAWRRFAVVYPQACSLVLLTASSASKRSRAGRRKQLVVANRIVIGEAQGRKITLVDGRLVIADRDRKDRALGGGPARAEQREHEQAHGQVFHSACTPPDTLALVFRLAMVRDSKGANFLGMKNTPRW